MKHLIRLLTFLLLVAAPLTAVTPVEDIAKRVDRRYNELRTLSADFVETYRGLGMSRTESGTLWLKKPGKMRWDYRQPHEKLFLIDGKTAYFYVPGDRQARKTAVKNLDDLRSPLRYLLGKTKLQKEFEDLAMVEGVPPLTAGNIVLRGVPRHLAERVSMVLLEVTPQGRIERIVAEDVDGSSTEFRFSNQREDVTLADSSFRFSAPPGVEVIEAATF
ncbi:MAG TPA: outer membrane lipoprotein chaperone LolA [Terriglobales bacterium]|nr:outer membrane lipoprotein chaperone LolA [Terriglobales bacterium]